MTSRDTPTRRLPPRWGSTREPRRLNCSGPVPGCERPSPTSPRTDEMLDDRFDDLLRESARDYNDPPETPREEMWAAMQAKRAEAGEEAEGKKADVAETRVLLFRRFHRFR